MPNALFFGIIALCTGDSTSSVGSEKVSLVRCFVSDTV